MPRNPAARAPVKLAPHAKRDDCKRPPTGAGRYHQGHECAVDCERDQDSLVDGPHFAAIAIAAKLDWIIDTVRSPRAIRAMMSFAHCL